MHDALLRRACRKGPGVRGASLCHQFPLSRTEANADGAPSKVLVCTLSVTLSHIRPGLFPPALQNSLEVLAGSFSLEDEERRVKIRKAAWLREKKEARALPLHTLTNICSCLP